MDWHLLSTNSNAIHILEKNLDKVDWHKLSKNPNAIPILEKHLDKEDWSALSENPNAIPLLFPYDYSAMKEKMKDFAKELAEKVYHPIRLERMVEYYGLEDISEYLDLLM